MLLADSQAPRLRLWKKYSIHAKLLEQGCQKKQEQMRSHSTAVGPTEIQYCRGCSPFPDGLS